MSKIKMMSVLMLLLCSIGLYAQSGFDPDLPPEPPEPPAPPAAKYLLTLVGDPVSGGTLTGGGEYEAGTVVSIKATASTGYKFVNWTQNDSIVSTAASFTFTKGELAETLVAHFVYDPSTPSEPDEPDIKPVVPDPVIPEHVVTAEAIPAGGATVSVSVGSVKEGSTTVVKATVNTGYVFQGWFVADTLYTQASSFTYTMGTEDMHFVARLKYDPGTPSEPDEPDIKPVEPDPVIPEHEVTAEAIPAGGGTVSVSASPVKEGSTTVLKITANTGYVFQGWYVADSLCSTATSYTYTMGTADVHFEARLTFDPSTPSEPTSTGNHRYNFYLSSMRAMPGRTVTYPVYTSTTDTLRDMHFQLTFTNDLIPRFETIQLSSKAEGYTVNYSKVSSTPAPALAYSLRRAGDTDSTTTYQLDLVGGTMPPSDTRLLTFDMDINENAADTVHQVTISQISVTNTDGSTETASAHNGSLEVNEPSEAGNFYYLNVVSTGNGQTRVNSRSVRNSMYTFDLLQGSSINAYFEPDAGYHISSVMLGDVDITTQAYQDGRYLLENVNSDMDLTVTFAEGSAAFYNLTLKPIGNGVITYDDQTIRDSEQVFSVRNAAAVELTITPDANHKIGSVMLNGKTDVTADVTDGKYSISSMVAATSVTVTFEQIMHNLTLTASGNGIISYGENAVRDSSSTIQIAQGTSAEIAITPDAHNHIGQVMLNGETDITSSVTNGIYTISNMTADVAISVVYMENPHVAEVQFHQDGYRLAMTSATDGALIYYIVGNGEPNVLYTDTLNLTESCTVRATAKHEGHYEDADITTFIFNADSVTVAAPVIASNGAKVGISTTTPEAVIHYTVDGTEPTEQSTVYTDSITVDHNCTVKAVAVRQNWFPSQVTSYAVDLFKVSSVTFAQNGYIISLSTPTSDATIRYTLSNGEAGEQTYSTPLTLTGDCTIEAYALREGYNNSDTTQFVFTAADVTVAAPVIASNGAKVGISTTTPEAVIYYTIDGTEPTAQSTVYTDSITVERNCTIKAIAMRQNWFNSDVATKDIDIFRVPNVHFAQDGRIVKLSNQMAEAKIWYRLSTSGSDAGIQYGDSLVMSEDCTIYAWATREGYNASDTTSLTFVAADVTVATPLIENNGAKVGISTTTPEAVIYYTIDGTEPTEQSTVYTDSITVERNCTIKAIAMRKNWFASEVTTFEFVAPIDATFDGRVLAVGGSTTMTDALESVGGRDEVAKTITAIVWNSSAALTNSDLQGLDNPNLLIYVNERSLAPQNRNNVVVNGLAKNVVLSDTGSGNCDFYAPQTFTAEMITYSREFKQATQVGVCRGWETISLPFMVQTIAHADNGVITPFGVDTSNKHFWLRQLSTNGLVSATKIEANLPYLISMPNDEKNYAKEYILKGLVTFSAENAIVPKTEPMALALADSSIVMMPALQSVGKSSTVWALNVGQERSQYFEGSTFERDYREVRPFEAYTIHRSDTPAPRFLPINDLMNSATGIETISNVIMSHDNYYHLDGRKVDGKPTKKGLYITNGRKVVIK